MKEKIIGVDYSDSITNGFMEVKITVVAGIKPVMYQKIIVKEFKDIFTPLLALSLKYNAKINFENNVHGLYLLFKEHKCLDLLRDNDIPRYLMCSTREIKGFTYVTILKDLFNKYASLLDYNKEFEDSYRIAVLPLIYSEDFQYKVNEVKCLETKLKQLKDSL